LVGTRRRGVNAIGQASQSAGRCADEKLGIDPAAGLLSSLVVSKVDEGQWRDRKTAGNHNR
jgi:hypothetical protein